MAKKPPTPRPRDAEQTRADILRAARIAFATRGYTQAGIRDIAKEAGITAALVVRYFGSKRDLFLSAIASDGKLTAVFEGERENLGQRVVQYLMTKPIREADTLSMMLLGAADEEIRELSTKNLQETLTRPLARWLGGPDAEARAVLILSVISGVWTYRVLLPIKPLSGTPDAAVVSALASMLQGLIDGVDAPEG
jgi:AcrR family transcriptional regulator